MRQGKQWHGTDKTPQRSSIHTTESEKLYMALQGALQTQEYKLAVEVPQLGSVVSSADEC